MRPLSATECISPAIARTKFVLFTPFRKGRTWKLSATAYLGRYGTMFFPFPIIYLFFLPAVIRTGSKGLVVALCVAVFVLTAIFVFIFHLCSRLQFAYFDIVLNRGEFVAPAWRKYGPQSIAWTSVKILVGSAVTLACALPIAAYVRHLIPIFDTLKTLKPGEQPPAEFIGAIFAGYGIILLVFGSFYLVSSLLSDFMLPYLALEDTGIVEAFQRMMDLVRREPGEFAIYTLLKLGLGLAAYMGGTIVWEIAFLLASVILGLFAALIGYLLHLAGLPSVALTALAILLGIAWYAFAIVYALFLVVGPAFTFLDAFALYFLGGRYPLIGDLLEHSTPPPIHPYAPHR
jgi:hypothetical protein